METTIQREAAAAAVQAPAAAFSSRRRPRAEPARRRDGMVAAVLALAVAALYLATLRPGIAWGDDFAGYLLHTRNLVLGLPYSATGYLYNPNFPHEGPRAYPPVFPALLAPVYALRGLDFRAFEAEIAICFALGVAFVYLAFATFAGRRRAVAVAAATGFCPELWSFRDQVLSDLPSMLAIYLALFLYLRGAPTRRAPAAAWAVLLAAALYVAFGLRTVGLLVAVAIGLAEAYERRRRFRPPVAVALALTVSGAAVTVLLIPGLGSYGDNVRVGVEPLVVNAVSYTASAIFFWGRLLPLAAAALALSAGLAIAGLRTAPGPPALWIFGLLYLGTLGFFWEFGDPEPRFLFPLVPLYAYYVAAGLRALARRLPRPAARLVAPVALGLLAASYCWQYVDALQNTRVDPGADSPEARLLFSWVRESTGRGDVLAFQKPRALALFTSRSGWRYDNPGRTAHLWAELEDSHTRFLITGPDPDPALDAFIQASGGRLTLVYDDSPYLVYRVD